MAFVLVGAAKIMTIAMVIAKGASREICDNNFCNCMRRICELYDILYLRNKCDASANLYCNAARKHGGGAFSSARKKCPACPEGGW